MLRIISEIRDQLKETNELLFKMEEHLRALTLPPDLTKYTKKGLLGDKDE